MNPNNTQNSVIDQVVPEGILGNGLAGTLNQLFYAGLVVVVALALAMVIRGAIQYMTTDGGSGKGDAKKRVQAALGGLVLAFSAILILNTINPGLTRLDLTFKPIQGLDANGVPITGNGTATSTSNPTPSNPTATSTTPIPSTPSDASEQALRELLAANGIGVNKAPCTSPGQTNCTNLAGLPDSAIQGMIQIKNQSGGNIVCTGGTEDGHATHGVGQAIVDLRKDSALDNWIISNSTSQYNKGRYIEYKHPNGTTYMNEGDHWHVQF